MSKSGKDKHANVRISTEVARQIRQHARSNLKNEVCGVLIGGFEDGGTHVRACISGANAAQGGAHVTFTQDTWEHIYKIKDRDFPDERIVGWYHSHPGFGIFLSDHDTFIHKNFFSAPEQVAWVFDPHSDEEGCFGWHGGHLERIPRFAFADAHGGEPANVSNKPEPARATDPDSEWEAEPVRTAKRQDRGDNQDKDDSASDEDLSKLARVASTLFSHLAVLVIGGLLVWYFLPRIVLMPVPVDPQTGRPLKEFMDREFLNSLSPNSAPAPSSQSRAPASPDAAKPPTKGNDAHP
jgi:proteasome lid subunit RPN8/RPN11